MTSSPEGGEAAAAPTGPAASFAEFEVPIDRRYLEDYRPGATYRAGEVLVDQSEVIAFATAYDPQFFHVDPTAAAHGPFGGLIASGWHTSAMMMRLYADHFLSTVASLGGSGVDELRWPRPVRPGDRLRLQVTVLTARPSQSKPDRGLIQALVQMHNQHDELAFSAVVVTFLKRRNASSSTAQR